MTETVSAPDDLDPASPERRRRPIGFAAGATIAAVLLILAMTLALVTNTEPTSSPVFWLLAASLAIGVGLAAMTARRILRIARARSRPESGARLHLRFVALFSLAAAAPALIVAVFLGALVSRNVEVWFNERVRTVVESSADVLRSYVRSAETGLHADAIPMAKDLSVAAPDIDDNPERYLEFLKLQAELRDFLAVYVVDSTGEIAVGINAPDAPPFTKPTAAAFADADGGEPSAILSIEENVFWALYPLAAPDGAYLYVVRAADPNVLARLRDANEYLQDYRSAESRRARLHMLFILAYISAALLVLTVAVRLGLATAMQFSAPIGRLARAAGRVAAGDLAVRVAATVERDELDALGRAFNRMTAQLETQRADLVSARQEAEAHSHFIEAVLSGVSAGVIGLSPKGRITVANPTAAQLLGAAPETLAGQFLRDIAPAFAEALDASPGRPHRIDLAIDGAVTHLLARRSAEPDGGSVLTFDDVTRLIRAQRHEAWRDVARRIAHEIKNPLTPIQLSAERLQRKYGGDVAGDADTFKRCTDTILRQVADIGRMVDEFSAFARMPTPEFAPLDLADLAREVTFAQRLTFPEIMFDVENAEAAPIVLGDERLIGQALTNILKNAAEAVQARDGDALEPGRVRLRFERGAGEIAIAVIDNGVGLPKDNRERLLDPYVTTRAKGTGLGLAIVRRVIEDHGGAIDLHDAPDQPRGAMVRLRLPAEWTPPDRDAPALAEAPAPQEVN